MQLFIRTSVFVLWGNGDTQRVLMGAREGAFLHAHQGEADSRTLELKVTPLARLRVCEDGVAKAAQRCWLTRGVPGVQGVCPRRPCEDRRSAVTAARSPAGRRVQGRAPADAVRRAERTL